MKVLILSCNTGQGHNSAAKAVKEQFDSRGIYCEIKDALSFASKRVSRYICNIYSKATIIAPKVAGGAYRAAAKISSSESRSVSYYANMFYSKALYRYIKENGFDTVVMPHVFPAEALTHIKKKYGCDCKTYFIATDYTCAPFTEETVLDGYFIPHEELREEFVTRGIPSERIFATGIPVSEKFKVKTDKISARKKLGLPQDKTILLLMGGSDGAGKVPKMLKLINKKISKDVIIIVLTANNKRLKTKLRKKYSEEKHILIKGFTKDMALYMDACDVFFTRPGGLSTTEAAVKNIPFVHTAAVWDCELPNVRFFAAHGLCGYGGDDMESAVAVAAGMLSDPQFTDTMLEAQRRTVNANAATAIAEHVISDGE